MNAETFILKMDKGIRPEVGEGGSRLSTGGKAAQISFARAVLADPAIFVLDEATSSVDTQTEQIIQHAIKGADRAAAGRAAAAPDLERIYRAEAPDGRGKMLRRLIERDQVSSMIFWGPPGVGKTTLATVIARQTQAKFIEFSAVTSGIKEIREVMEQAEARRRFGERTILFVDEIHRFNKAQQDAFLPFVEKGSIVLIGATTENPSFEVNSALLSRCKVFVLQAADGGGSAGAAAPCA